MRLSPSAVALAGALLGLACGTDGAPSPTGSAEPAPPYTFAAPDMLVELPGRLDEVSGLAWLGDGRLAAVQDEKGDLFVLDAATGEVVGEVDFGSGGDYEGVERAGADGPLWVLRSDGTLFRLDGWAGDRADAEAVATGMHAGCDAEGLAFQPDPDRLLVACKEAAGRGLDGRAVYGFRLATGALSPGPVLTLDVEDLERRLGRSGSAARRLASPLGELSPFKPSALALHPLTGELWVLSSVAKAVAVVQPGGAVRAVWALPDGLFRQPEGLTFAPDGTLFVASEARGKKAVLARYRYQPAP